MRHYSRIAIALSLVVCVACGSSDGPAGSGGEAGKADAGSPGSAGTGASTSGAPSTAGSASAGDAGSGGASLGGGGSGGAGVAGDGGSGGAVGGTGGMTSGRPNVVVVLLDDMGFSDLSPYGGEIRTPSIAALAAGGTRFRNYYVTPRCSPTRLALMTGAYTQQVATEPGASLPPMRPKGNITLPEMLSSAGYRTYMAGKWHLGENPDQTPRSRGFDYVFGMGPDGAGGPNNKFDPSLYGFVGKDDAIKARHYPATPGAFFQSDAIGDYALDYLSHHEKQKDDKPFFMYLAFNSPHFPLQAPRSLIEDAPAGGGESYLKMYARGWTEMRNRRYQNMLDQQVISATYGMSMPEEFMSGQSIPLWSTLDATRQADMTRKMAIHAAMIESVDMAVGRVVARLKEIGQFDNTLIFVMTDNGGNYEGGIFGASNGSTDAVTGAALANMGTAQRPDDAVKVGGGWANVQNTPYRLFKHYTHGGGVRSPLVVSWPAHTSAPGGWTEQVAHVIDITPTILAAAGVTQPTLFKGEKVVPIEGLSLVDTISEGAAPFNREIGFEHEGNRAYISGSYKLVVREHAHEGMPVEPAHAPELYNLDKDPTELNDLAGTQKMKLTKLIESWNVWAQQVGVPADRQLEVP